MARRPEHGRRRDGRRTPWLWPPGDRCWERPDRVWLRSHRRPVVRARRSPGPARSSRCPTYRAGRSRPCAARSSDCDARSVAVADSSWLAAAFCCTTSSSWLTPTLISRIAAICSCEAAAISWIRFEVSRIIGHRPIEQRAGVLGHGHAFLGEVADLLGGGLAPLGKLADLAGNDREPLAVRAGPGRLDGGVQGQQVGLVGDVVDDQDLLGDLAHGHDRLADRLAPFLGLAAGFVGHPGRVLGVLGVAADRGVDRLQAAGDLLERGGLLGRALRQLIGARIQLVAGGRDRGRHVPDLADDLGQAGRPPS